MNDTFSVGEIALIHYPGSKWHGTEVIVNGPLYVTDYYNTITGTIDGPEPCYPISRPGPSGPYVSPPRYLRKRHIPPRPKEELGEWELCPWRPASPETVSATQKGGDV